VSDELQLVIEGLARDLARAVAVDDRDLRLLAFTSHSGAVDDARQQAIMTRQAPAKAAAWARSHGISKATKPVRIPANAELGMLPRVCVPLRAHGAHFGFLWLIDPDEALTDADLRQAAAAAAQCAEVLHRLRVREDLADARERELLRDLMSDDASVREMAAAEVIGADLFDLRGPMTAMVVGAFGTSAESEAVRRQLTAAIERAVSDLPRRTCVRLIRPTHGLVVASAAALRSRPHLAEDLAGHKGGAVLAVGTGAPVTRLSDLATSYQQAQRALRVAAMVPMFRPVAHWSELGVYALLSELSMDRLVETAVHPAVRRLLREEPSLAETLEGFLDRAGDTKVLAADLHLHRASVYYRLNRIQEITGIRLDDGEQRLALHLSLKVARLIGLSESPAGAKAVASGRS
jgi:sugar diacid utilization regulator